MDNERKYTASHPWLTFFLDFKEAPYELWVLLGAVESKCKHLAGIPLRPEKQDELNRVTLRKGVQATTAIEGNSLSEEEIQKIIDGKKGGIPRSKEYQRIEVENVVDAYSHIADLVNRDGVCSASLSDLMNDNEALLRNLNLPDVVPGAIRTHGVGVGNYLGAPAEDCAYLLERLFAWLGEPWGFSEEHNIIEGLIKAITAHLYIAWIHPFGDGNGRGARMLEFRLLMACGVPLTAAHLLTTYYNETRTEYYLALAETSRKTSRFPMGNPLAFIQYALQGFLDKLDGEIKAILKEQLNVTWENYIHNTKFPGKLSEADARRRDLLLEISKFDVPIEIGELRLRLPHDTLSLYARKTPRTLSRDLGELERRELVTIFLGNWVAANKDKMRAFLPICKQDEPNREFMDSLI